MIKGKEKYEYLREGKRLITGLEGKGRPRIEGKVRLGKVKGRREIMER